jgi:hypothetical protein
MSKCPKCGSIRIIKANEDVSICLACESFLNTINGKSKPTLFARITASPEVLAPEFVEMMYDRVSGDYRYYSVLTGEFYNSREEAIAATLEKLKEVEK